MQGIINPLTGERSSFSTSSDQGQDYEQVLKEELKKLELQKKIV